MNVKNSNDLHYLWWLTLTAALGALIYLLSPILTPFLLAGLIAYICNPLVTKVAAWNISRALSTILVIMILLGASIAIILTIIPLFDKEISLFSRVVRSNRGKVPLTDESKPDAELSK